jgi:heme-degrading monooxygenase HmoA
VIEITRFRLVEGADEEQFLRADRELQEHFAYQQPGLLRRTTARDGGGNWVVVDLWRSAADAEAGAAAWDRSPQVRAFMRLVEPSSFGTERYQEIG